jgi:hypothetical protein
MTQYTQKHLVDAAQRCDSYPGCLCTRNIHNNQRLQSATFWLHHHCLSMYRLSMLGTYKGTADSSHHLCTLVLGLLCSNVAMIIMPSPCLDLNRKPCILKLLLLVVDVTAPHTPDVCLTPTPQAAGHQGSRLGQPSCGFGPDSRPHPYFAL